MRRSLPAAPTIVGIVNVTPDSFSDGGTSLDAGHARDHALRLVAEGAGILDIGAESTRPGATPVSPEEEQRRLLPALVAIRASVAVPLLVDTRNASTGQAALDAGADGLNDVSMLRHDPALASVAAREGATLVIMHSRGTPETMQGLPMPGDVVSQVRAELAAALAVAREAGCDPARLIADPGFGFAKDREQNLELLRRLPELCSLGAPIFVGLSRKNLVGQLLAIESELGLTPRPVAERAAGSVGLALAAFALGARYLRVHDVAMTSDALRTFAAILPALVPSSPPSPAALASPREARHA